MELRRTENIYKDTAEHIVSLIEAHPGTTVCFLAGGSAFAAFKDINLSTEAKGRTIFIMGDERVTGEVKTNNFLQLESRYRDHELIGRVLNTSAGEKETPENFATRIKNVFETKKRFCFLYKMYKNNTSRGDFRKTLS